MDSFKSLTSSLHAAVAGKTISSPSMRHLSRRVVSMVASWERDLPASPEAHVASTAQYSVLSAHLSRFSIHGPALLVDRGLSIQWPPSWSIGTV